MTKDRPNIILIITDQQRYDTIKQLGFPYMDTPNLDRMVSEGTSFTHTFVTSPSCAPSRGSLFTGMFPHTTGIYKNDALWRHSWVENLSDRGYHCVNVGKMHTSPHDTPLGFHERFVVENKDRQHPSIPFYFDEWDKALRTHGLTKPGRTVYRKYNDYKKRLGAFEWDLPENMHPDMFVGDMAKWWLDEHPKIDQPLFLQIGFPGPHPPYDPINRFADNYMKKDLPLPNVTEKELREQPEPLRELRQQHLKVDHDAVVHLKNPTLDQQHRQRAYYFANVTMIDEKIGEIFDSLDNNGYLENSVVIFTSDHGDCLGDHGHSQKWNMYEETIRIPLIVWAPDYFEKGRRVDSLTQLMDLGPTILDLAGVQPSEKMEACSLLPILNEQSAKGREYVFAEHCRDEILQSTEFMTMIRNDEWKLVHFTDNGNGQLFNLKSDANEKHNLWDNPNYESKKNELVKEILNWRIQSGLKTQKWGISWR